MLARYELCSLSSFLCLQLLDELCRIHPTAYNFQTFQMLLSDCSPKILALAIKKKFSSRHPLGKILQCVENDNSNKGM